jgi:hypothetical protein
MSERLSTRNARLIRAGINANCEPYDGKILDFRRYREYQIAWLMAKDSPVAERAYIRTGRWVSKR